MKSVISSAMPSGAIAGKAATASNSAMNKNNARAGFVQPSGVMKTQLGGNSVRDALSRPTAHSYKAADFTVQMNMEDANKIQGQDR